MAELKRIHILPVQNKIPEDKRLSTLAPELKRIRSEGSSITSGKVIAIQSQKFVVFECDPKEGRLGQDTEFFTNGDPVPVFSKIQLNATRQPHSPAGLDAEGLLCNYVKPFFHSLNSSGERTQLLEVGQKVPIFDMMFEVKASEPMNRVGVVQSSTTVYADWDAGYVSQHQVMASQYNQAAAAEEEMIRQAIAMSRGSGGGGYGGGGYGGYSAPPGSGPRDTDDPELAAAIAASYSTSTHGGREQTEDEMLQQAIRMSQMEEESRQRSSLKDQQEAELQESILMDKMREEEEKKKRKEDEDAEMARLEEIAQKKEQEKQEREAAESVLKAAQSRLTEEPADGEPGRVKLVLRLPSGKRVQRSFRSKEKIGLIYDFVDVQQFEELDGKKYRLFSNMPKTFYEDRAATLEGAGITNGFALMVEIIQTNTSL